MSKTFYDQGRETVILSREDGEGSQDTQLEILRSAQDDGRTFFIETWGCQMNDLDSQRLSGSLKLRGYRRVDDERQAGLILLNTCSIREKAENKVYSRLGELRAVDVAHPEVPDQPLVAQPGQHFEALADGFA